jgi:hypothetical protein
MKKRPVVIFPLLFALLTLELVGSVLYLHILKKKGEKSHD